MSVARRLDVPSVVIDVETAGAPPAVTRAARYDALTAAAIDARAGWVATGHHAGDQLETVLAALGRGAGPTGLAGMACARPLHADVTLIRPMLQCTRVQAAELCTRAGISWCDDPGNDDPQTQRGRLRRDVIPVLEAMWPGVAPRVSAMSETQSMAATAFEGVIAARFGPVDRSRWDRRSLRELPAAVLASGLRRSVLATTGLTSDAISHPALASAATCISDAGMHRREFEIGGGVRIVVDAQNVSLEAAAGT